MLIELPDNKVERINVNKSERIGSSSNSFSFRGNQVKWLSQGRVVKLDCLGYESKAECLVSWLLRFTNLSRSEYIIYYSCNIYEEDVYLGRGCYSYNFKQQAEEITVAEMLEQCVASFSIKYDELLDLLYDIVHFNCKRYIDKILCLDAITRNDDRHFGNISFLKYDSQYKCSPLFDNGGSCMSDTIMYPMTESFEANIERIQAKPFKTDFVKQLYNVEPILIKYDEFLNSTSLHSVEALRALETIKYGLAETEGIAWRRC